MIKLKLQYICLELQDYNFCNLIKWLFSTFFMKVGSQPLKIRCKIWAQACKRSKWLVARKCKAWTKVQELGFVLASLIFFFFKVSASFVNFVSYFLSFVFGFIYIFSIYLYEYLFCNLINDINFVHQEFLIRSFNLKTIVNKFNYKDYMLKILRG